MALTWEAVALLAPELADLDEDVQAAILADVSTRMGASPGSWKTAARYELAGKYLAAHLATLRSRGGAAGASGPVIGETVGPISRQYAAPASGSGSGSHSSTAYGQEFDRLAMTLIPGRIGLVA